MKIPFQMITTSIQPVYNFTKENILKFWLSKQEKKEIFSTHFILSLPVADLEVVEGSVFRRLDSFDSLPSPNRLATVRPVAVAGRVPTGDLDFGPRLLFDAEPRREDAGAGGNGCAPNIINGLPDEDVELDGL